MERIAERSPLALATTTSAQYLAPLDEEGPRLHPCTCTEPLLEFIKRIASMISLSAGLIIAAAGIYLRKAVPLIETKIISILIAAGLCLLGSTLLLLSVEAYLAKSGNLPDDANNVMSRVAVVTIAVAICVSAGCLLWRAGHMDDESLTKRPFLHFAARHPDLLCAFEEDHECSGWTVPCPTMVVLPPDREDVAGRLRMCPTGCAAVNNTRPCFPAIAAESRRLDLILVVVCVSLLAAKAVGWLSGAALDRISAHNRRALEGVLAGTSHPTYGAV